MIAYTCIANTPDVLFRLREKRISQVHHLKDNYDLSSFTRYTPCCNHKVESALESLDLNQEFYKLLHGCLTVNIFMMFTACKSFFDSVLIISNLGVFYINPYYHHSLSATIIKFMKAMLM